MNSNKFYYVDETHVIINDKYYTLFPRSGGLSIGSDPRIISETLKNKITSRSKGNA